MKRFLMKTNVIIVFIAILVFVFMFIGCASTGGGKGDYQEIQNTQLKEAKSYGRGKKIKTTVTWSGTGINLPQGLRFVSSFGVSPNGNEILFSEKEYPSLLGRLEANKEYTVYLTVMRRHWTELNIFALDKIEVLKSIEVYEAEQNAAAEARLAARWAPRNPNNLDRSQYRRMSVSDFTFGMSAGTLPIGSKVWFECYFLARPTGTNYNFRNIALTITFTSRHNFAGRMKTEHFQETFLGTSRLSQWPVQVFVTVTRAGQLGECSVDIMNWPEDMMEYLGGGWR